MLDPLKKFYRAGRYAAFRAFAGVSGGALTRYSVRPITPPKAHCFFGYHNLNPWDRTGRYLLCLKAPFANRMPTANDRATVCVIDTAAGNALTAIGQTTAWCWQQGCMLQWIIDGDEEFLLYNDRVEGKLVTRICRRDGSLVRTLPKPTYAVSMDGKMAVSINFELLDRYAPGYGYAPVTAPLHASENREGISLMDCATGHSQLILSLDDLRNTDPRPEFATVTHYVNHLQFSPGGGRILFFHRWVKPPNLRTNTRVYTVSTTGSDLHCLYDHGIFSHYCWLDECRIMGTSGRPLGGLGYDIYEDRTGRAEAVGGGVLTEDGHPSLSPTGRWVVTDTYQDRWRYRTLLIYDLRTNQRKDIGRFFVPNLYEGALRCDLHPRWNRDGTRICFDSVHQGYRRLYVADVIPAGSTVR